MVRFDTIHRETEQNFSSAIIATGSLHPSSSDRAIEMRRPDNLRLQKRNSLACDFFSNPVDGKVELQKDSHSQSDQPSSGPMSIRKGIVFTTGEKSQPHTPLKPTENDEEEEANLSDDSFVKVVPFASTEDLGADLSEFFKEVRLAPKNLPSFAGEGTDILSRQVCYA
jgi:hypothetical protein